MEVMGIGSAIFERVDRVVLSEKVTLEQLPKWSERANPEAEKKHYRQRSHYVQWPWRAGLVYSRDFKESSGWSQANNRKSDERSGSRGSGWPDYVGHYTQKHKIHVLFWIKLYCIETSV